ncbi:MAG TPA: hemerythrin domain-containing protein [Terriglobia bacterium]|nr:hemerythrin domain-containing protein [Terriglobia bacterium]
MFGRRNKSSVLKWGLIGSAIAGGIALIPLVPVLKKRAMRATTILKKDHRMVSGLLMTLEMTPKINGMVRRALFNQIRQSLMIHTRVEEEIFYPAIQSLTYGGEGSKVDEAYREHQTVKDLLNQMATMDAVSDEFDGKLAELKQNIQHHVQKEEGEMFPLVTSRMSTERLEEIGQQMHDRKINLKTQMAA